MATNSNTKNEEYIRGATSLFGTEKNVDMKIKKLLVGMLKNFPYGVPIPPLTENKMQVHEINITWDYLRGLLDMWGYIDADLIQCKIYHYNLEILSKIQSFCDIPSLVDVQKKSIVWSGINATDFLASLYNKNSALKLEENYLKFLKMANPSPMEGLPTFKWCKTVSDAVPPSKTRFSDSGFDLTLVRLAKSKDNVFFYDTGIQIEPPNGYYFDLVARSSVSKLGWTLANNIGIIDSSYRGSIMAAFVKTRDNADPIQLPNRLVQIIPRKLILMDFEETSDMSRTQRGAGGFGSTNR